MSDATDAAERGTADWLEAVRLQRSATPDHNDFYALGGELVAAVRALREMVAVLAGQVRDYGEGRSLRDDEGGDPSLRRLRAGIALEQAGAHLSSAEASLEHYWSALGHIGLAEPTTESED